HVVTAANKSTGSRYSATLWKGPLDRKAQAIEATALARVPSQQPQPSRCPSCTTMMDQIRAQGEAEDELCHQLSGVREKLSEAQAENRQMKAEVLRLEAISATSSSESDTTDGEKPGSALSSLGQILKFGKRRRTSIEVQLPIRVTFSRYEHFLFLKSYDTKCIEIYARSQCSALNSVFLGSWTPQSGKIDSIRRTRVRGAITYLSPATADALKLPETVDWREKKAPSLRASAAPVGLSPLPGLWRHFRRTGQLVSLSEQQLVDCSASFGNAGCNGGLMDDAFQYARQYGLETEASYPYVAEQEPVCRFNTSLVVANCTGFVDVPPGSEAKLQEAVANFGPVSVAIDASHHSFQLYRSGVYDEPACSPSNLDHGVLLVGYGTDRASRAKYWLVKNSWNSHWGEAGYVRIARDKGNMCGVASSASYPTV
uniref:Pept_C1 domain-containing protein n=1 Tax=Macrostomum lignano TaxID=282301 RepID=A0A1I8I0I8_9PLAT